MHNSFITLEKRVRNILSNFLPFFLNSKNKNYIKSNSELIFLTIFSKINDEEINEIIEKFAGFFYKNSFENDARNFSSYLLIEIYNRKNAGVSNLEQYTFHFEGIDQFDFTKKEITCYLSILTNKIDNNIERYYNNKKIESMKTTIPTINDVYFFTHDIFYLTYLNSKQEFFDLMDPNKKKHINEYIFSNMVFCMIDDNIDLLGELLICYILVNGQIDKSNPLINMSLGFIEQYVSEIDSIMEIDELIFLQTYHNFSDINSYFNSKIRGYYMSKSLRLLSFHSYRELEPPILNYDIVRRVVFVFFFKKNGMLTRTMQRDLETSYYKVSSINEEIVKISPEKYEELVAHILMNILFNEYYPSESDVRLLNGIIIYANENSRGILYLLLTLVLRNCSSFLKFYDLKNGIKFGRVMQNIFRILDKEEYPFCKGKFLYLPDKKGRGMFEMQNHKFEEEMQIEKQEKIIEMKESIIELDEQLIELQEAEIERQERQIELQEMALERDSE